MAKKQATEEQALYEFINYGKIVFAKLFTMWTSMFLLWTSTGVANEFFKSLMLITIPQLLYAYSIRAKNTLRSVVSLLSVIIILGLFFIGFLGILGKITLVETDLGYFLTINDGKSSYSLVRSVSVVYFMVIALSIIYIVEWGTGYKAKGE